MSDCDTLKRGNTGICKKYIYQRFKEEAIKN